MTHDDKPLLSIVRTLWLPLIPKTAAEVKDHLSEKFPFSDGAFQPDAERFLKIGQPRAVIWLSGFAPRSFDVTRLASITTQGGQFGP